MTFLDGAVQSRRGPRAASLVGRFAVVAGVVAAIVFAGSAIPAAAAIGDSTLNVQVAQTDGSPGYDALDGNGTNGLVRTNDTISYLVSVRNEAAIPGGGQVTNPTITFTLPQGQELLQLPAFCLNPGSSITPTSLGSLPHPLNTTSWQALPTQSVVCRLADRTTGSQTLDYTFVAKVRGEVPNGTLMDPFTATGTAAEFPGGDTSNAVQATVVAEPDYDLSKNGTSDIGDNTAFVPQSTEVCVNPAYASAGYTGCQTMLFPILISVQAGGKGNTPSSSDITFTDDITPAGLWGASVVGSAGWSADFAPSIVGCGVVTNLSNGSSLYPFGALPGHGVTNSVRDSGTISCAAGATGVVPVTISGADTTAITSPTTNGTANVTMPTTKAYVVSGWIKIEFPVAALQAVGTALPGSPDVWTLGYTNRFAGLTMNDLAGDPAPAETNLANNVLSGTSRVSLAGTFGKVFVGEPGNPTNSGGAGYAAGNYAGPAGSSNGGDGAGVVQAGGKVNGFLSKRTVSPPGFGAATAAICDSWDNSKLALTAAQWRGLVAGTSSPAAPFGTAGFQQSNPSNGAAVWLSSSLATTVYVPVYTVEYGAGTGSAATVNGCLDSTTGWFASPAAVPGNDPALAAEGIYTAVGQVRIVYEMQSTLASNDTLTVAFSIGYTVRDSVVSGDIIGNWASSKLLYGAASVSPSAAATIAAPGDVHYNSNYVPANHTGALGDRVHVEAAVARVLKQVWDSSTSTYVSASVPVYATGDAVKYRVQPSVTAGITTGATSDTSIEDCLPLNETFVESSIEGGAAVVPDVVSDGSPVGAGLTCAPGRTYLRWNLGAVAVNAAIPAILYTATVDETAPNGTLTNTVQITAAGDASAAAARQASAQIQIVTPTGIKLSKTTLTPTVDLNPAGATHPRTLAWNVRFAAIDTAGVTNAEVIDVLPANGLNGSSFTGTLALSSATPTSTTGTPVVLYTKRAAASIDGDPHDTSNLAAGSTVWCDAPAGGSVVSGTGGTCPAALAEVTALRVIVPGSFPAGSRIDLAVVMTPSDNAAADVYNNAAFANANGVLQGVGPVLREIAITGGSLGDVVWLDSDRDGIQGPGETGVDSVPVHLSGTDLDGNTIALDSMTTAGGHYLFGGLPAGSYFVTFDPAWVAAHGYGFTPQGAGSDSTRDADGDVVAGRTDLITLAVSENRIDVDEGLVLVPPPLLLAFTGSSLAGPILASAALVAGGLAMFLARRRFGRN